MADWDGRLKQNWGGIEHGNTFDGGPAPVWEGAVIDGVKPPPGCTVVQKMSCRPKDGHYGSSTGYRCLFRQHEPIQLRDVGYASHIGIAIQLPGNYPGGANMWVAPFELHQTSPGGVTGVANMHLIFDGSGLSFDVNGGNTPQSGGIGNPGWIRTYSAHWPINERNVMHLIWLYYKYGLGDGEFQLFHAVAGRDKAFTPLTPLVTGKYTAYRDLKFYPEVGIYRQDSGNADTDFYIAGAQEKTDKAAMATWMHTMLGVAVTPPVPDPTPVPVPVPIPVPAKVTANASVKSGAHLAAGKRYTIMVDTTGLVAKMRFYLDGKQFDEDTGGPARNGRFVTGLNLTLAKPGAHTFGFASIAPDGKEIAGATFKAYPITVDPKPAPSTNAEHLERGLGFLRLTTESFQTWNKRTPAKKVGTMWAKGLDELKQIT